MAQASTKAKRKRRKPSKALEPFGGGLLARWVPSYSYFFLGTLTLAILLPFSSRAFAFDDPLFIWAAQHIVQHPFDPYGFRLVWYSSVMAMSDVTKNPPLASYFAAAAGSVAGWSERTLHLTFVLPTLVAVLATYRLAQRFTSLPLLAALALLVSPGFLVSAASVMCDVPMLALWLLAALFWLEASESDSNWKFAASAILLCACTLTKYFGAALIPLLLADSLARKRRFTPSMLYALVPIVGLIAYQFWTHSLYGHALLSDAVGYHNDLNSSSLPQSLVGVAFLGGCFAPALLFLPMCWSRRWLLIFAAICLLTATMTAYHWIDLNHNGVQAPESEPHAVRVGVQFGIWFAVGISILCLGVLDLREHRDPNSLFLALWVAGTFVFAAFLNWTINARSLLPAIPAAAILIARRLEAAWRVPPAKSTFRFGVALVASACLSLYVLVADTQLANSAREAVQTSSRLTQNAHGSVWFQGHWGYQYYMQLAGARPYLDKFEAGDIIITPENNTNQIAIPRPAVASGVDFTVEDNRWLSTFQMETGAGFYTAVWGPLPFAFGPVPLENYELVETDANR